MTVHPVRQLIAALAMVLCTFPSYAQIAHVSPVEIEKRNAAAAFATTREASLFMLMGECPQLMRNVNPDVETVARGWFDRNRMELEAAYTWLDRYLAYLKSTNAALYEQASTNLTTSVAQGTMESARSFFHQKRPDLASCEWAVKTFSVASLDFKNMARNRGYEQFAEFPETLARIRSDPDFAVPAHLKFGMDKGMQTIRTVGNMASLDAADMALKQGNGPERIAILTSLAERGDGNSATQIGIMYLNGFLTETNMAEAYRWFYAAWSLSDMGGLNALGVMNRDALGVAANPQLAGTAFYLAKAGARNRETFDRASGNLDKMRSQLDPRTLSQIACTRLSDLDAALQAPMHDAAPLVRAKTISQPERRLGGFIPELSQPMKSASCS